MDPKAKETALRSISYGLYVVGAKGDNEINGMTANWVTQVSFEPPLVVLAVENDAHTRRLIDQGKVFVINILRTGQYDLVEKFVQPQERVGNKLGDVAFHLGETGAPVLDDALAFFECEVEQTVQTGDHVLYVGRVVNAGVLHEDEPLTLKEMGWDYGG